MGIAERLSKLSALAIPLELTAATCSYNSESLLLIYTSIHSSYGFLSIWNHI